MSMTKSVLSNSTNQVTKPKEFKLRQCIKLAKKFFSCKSPQQHTQNKDYEYINYGHFNNTAVSIEPLSSTAIDYKQYKYNSSETSSSLKDISQITFDESSDNVCSAEIEQTRQTLVNNKSNQLNESSETIIQNVSPMYGQYCLLNSSSAYSINDYFLQSTKILNDISRIEQSILPSPVISSTSIDFNSNEYNSLNSFLTHLYSIQQQATSTHVCVCDYEATFVDDLQVEVGDVFRVVKSNDDEWFMVQLEDGRQGFVPKRVVTEINDFISCLEVKVNCLKSKSSVISLPIKV